MNLQPPFFSDLVAALGRVGQQLTVLGSAEGAAGNLSVFVRSLEGIEERFRFWDVVALPVSVPALADGCVIVTSSGCRLRDVAENPAVTLCLMNVLPGGNEAARYAVQDLRPSSEFNSHLAVHQQHVRFEGARFHAVVHAQPRHLVYLSHLAAYGSTVASNRALLRWQPETVLVFPEGIGYLPYATPSSAEQMQQTMEGLSRYRAVVWQRHGIVTRSERSLEAAADLVEYAETAAQYEYMNLLAGQAAIGLSLEDLRKICDQYGVKAPILEEVLQ